MEYFLNPFYLICLYLFYLIALYPFNLIRIYSFNSIRKNIYFISGTGSSHRIRKIWTCERKRFTCSVRPPLQGILAVQKGNERRNC